MNGKFRHSMKKYGGCFNCVATLTQLLMDHGGVGLFPVVYILFHIKETRHIIYYHSTKSTQIKK